MPVHVQGRLAPVAIARALGTVAASGCDVTVLVRGGGAKADLAAFDSEAVARAVASHPVPVWTGIGHTGDQSVADILANRAFVTPTECGQELVRRVLDWWADTAGAARLVVRRAAEVVEQAQIRDGQARHRLGRATRHQLHRHAERLGTRATRLAAQAGRQVEATTLSLERRAARLGPGALAVVERESGRTLTWRRLLTAYDVDRQLERGYSLTLDVEGRVVRSASSLSAGDEVLTRFADGTARSVVQSTEARADDEEMP